MEINYILTFSGIAFLGFFCQWVAWKMRLPAILFLLMAGIVSGSVLNLLNPDQVFGEMLFPVVSVAVAIILFEGSLSLKFKEIKGIEKVVWRMVTVGVLFSWLSIALFCYWLLDLDWHLAALFGAMVVVTGPTVIGPMLRSVRPQAAIANILRWESILIDPLGALLAVLVFNFIVVQTTGGNEWLAVTFVFGKILIAGALFGCGAGYLCGILMRKDLIPEFLHNFFILASVVVVFGLSNTLEHESGLLAVTVMGIWLANMRGVETADIVDFKESLSIVLISGLFILLAARVDINELITLGWQSLLVLAFVQLVARPLKILFSTLGADLNWREKVMISWIGPRGIIAAAVSALFAIRLDQLGFENANVLVTLTFVVIIGTVVLQSLTAKPLAKFLGVREPSPQGLLIVGANGVARAIAKAVKASGFEVLLADSYRTNILEARMLGLKVFLGNPVSSLAEKEINLVGIGRMLGLSQNEDLNFLAAQRYQREFGKKGIFTLGSQASQFKSERHLVSEDMKGQVLFGGDCTYGKLASMIARGAVMRTTNISEEFTLEDYIKQYGDNKVIPMFVVTTKKKLLVLTKSPTKEEVVSGCKIIALVPVEED